MLSPAIGDRSVTEPPPNVRLSRLNKLATGARLSTLSSKLKERWLAAVNASLASVQFWVPDWFSSTSTVCLGAGASSSLRSHQLANDSGGRSAFLCAIAD